MAENKGGTTVIYFECAAWKLGWKAQREDVLFTTGEGKNNKKIIKCFVGKRPQLGSRKLMKP